MFCELKLSNGDRDHQGNDDHEQEHQDAKQRQAKEVFVEIRRGAKKACARLVTGWRLGISRNAQKALAGSAEGIIHFFCSALRAVREFGGVRLGSRSGAIRLRRRGKGWTLQPTLPSRRLAVTQQPAIEPNLDGSVFGSRACAYRESHEWLRIL